jgi:fimbrial chaperone protein
MRPRLALAAGLALAFAASAATAAGQLQAGPTLLEIQPGGTSARLRLSNSGDVPVSAQVRVYAWTQEGGADRLQETDAVVASPPIAEVSPDGEHLVRVVLTGAAPADARDRTYRVVVDELPGAPETAASGVQVRMRYVVPLFVRAAGASAPALSCRLFAAGARLACRNAGGQPAQLGATTLRSGASSLELSAGLYGYVLPGGERAWELPAARPASAGPMTLETRINGQPASVAVERQP